MPHTQVGERARVHLTEERCVGHGRCYALAPDVFEPDDEGHCTVLVAEVSGEQVARARHAVENCPERALTLEN